MPNRPSIRELPGDLLTPVAAFLRLRGRGPGFFLLESIERGQQVGRYSFLGTGCNVLEIGLDTEGDLFAAAREALARHASVDHSGLPPFSGGIVGHVTYDAVSRFEPTVALPPPRDGDTGVAARFLEAPVVVAFDHVRQTIHVIAQPGYDREAEEIADMLLGEPRSVPLAPPAPYDAPFVPEIAKPDYLDMVRTAKRHIVAGDAFQIVPSQRVSRRVTRSPFAIYRALRTVNPSPYMFYLDDGRTALVGASPETHVALDSDRVASLRPIAGTRPRGPSAAEDDALAAELLADEKERAEHLMLVDLARNDLARVCEVGTVRPSRLLDVERYSHVMHLVSSVEGRLRADGDAFSLLEATFPAGTVSGAPKVRAMQIISALEPHRRGIYAGAVGYVSYSGTLDTCIALRTIVVTAGVAHLQAGGGVVVDSDPELEWQETMNKMAALRQAIELAETGRYGA